MKKKQIILPKLRYENSPQVDSLLRIGFEEQKSLLRTDDRDIVLDLSEQFATERANCDRYKLYGKMKMIFRNLYLGTVDNYSYLRKRLSLRGNGTDDPYYYGYLPYDEFAFFRNEVYKEVISNTSVSSLDTFTGFNMIGSGPTGHVLITPITAPYHNWNIYLTYVSGHTYNFPMKYTLSGDPKIEGDNLLTFVSGEGIPFRVQSSTTEYMLTSPVRHGMNQGEYIRIKGHTTPYYINSVGNGIYNSEYYVINVLKSQLGSSVLNSLVVGKRCTDINDLDNSTSHYYVHKHFVLTSQSDYIMDKVGFESPIWEDEKKLLFENCEGDNDVLVERNRMESVLFDFKEPYILKDITNNLGYTPTELYTTIIFRNGNGYFNYPPKVGYSFHFHNTWVDKHFDGTSSNETSIESEANPFIGEGIDFYSGKIIPQGALLNGAFVEYHPKEMKERIISEAFHKITASLYVFDHFQNESVIYGDASSGNPFGSYYQPHYRFKLRELSPYTETSDTNEVENLPENARYFPNENLWRWRDLYDDGYIDPDGYGTDYPYLNDIHYIHKDINFYLRNEYLYTNKDDGVSNFYKSTNIDGCQ